MALTVCMTCVISVVVEFVLVSDGSPSGKRADSGFSCNEPRNEDLSLALAPSLSEQ